MDTKSKSTLFDVLTGIVCAVASFFILQFFPFNVGFMLITPLPFIAGIIRGKNSNGSPLARAIIINMLFGLLFMAVMNGIFYLSLIPVAAITGTLLGIHLRQQFSTSKFKFIGFSALFFAIVIVIGVFGLPKYFEAILWRTNEVAAPTFELLTPAGDTIKSSDYANKVIVMDFWTTWCGPCKRQFPVMEKIYKKYKGNQNVVFFAINANMRGDSFEKAVTFIEKSSYDLPFVIDIDGMTTEKFDVLSVPTIKMLDKKGNVRLTHIGYEESEDFYENFSNKLDLLIAEN